MTPPGYGRQIDLRDGTSMHLDDARGTLLRVTRGQLWVTQHHDTRDVVLVAGDAFAIERDGLTIATAMGDTSVALVGEAATQVDADGRRLRWPDRIVAWFERFDEARVGRRWAPYV
jgi:hypothetical protein